MARHSKRKKRVQRKAKTEEPRVRLKPTPRPGPVPFHIRIHLFEHFLTPSDSPAIFFDGLCLLYGITLLYHAESPLLNSSAYPEYFYFAAVVLLTIAALLTIHFCLKKRSQLQPVIQILKHGPQNLEDHRMIPDCIQVGQDGIWQKTPGSNENSSARLLLQSLIPVGVSYTIAVLTLTAGISSLDQGNAPPEVDVGLAILGLFVAPLFSASHGFVMSMVTGMLSVTIATALIQYGLKCAKEWEFGLGAFVFVVNSIIAAFVILILGCLNWGPIVGITALIYATTDSWILAAIHPLWCIAHIAFAKPKQRMFVYIEYGSTSFCLGFLLIFFHEGQLFPSALPVMWIQVWILKYMNSMGKYFDANDTKISNRLQKDTANA